MESSSDPPKKPPDGGGAGGGDDDDDRKPPADADSMTDVDRTNALKSHRIRYEDAVDPNAERVTAIQPHDVVLGRGKRLQDMKGNVRMRRIAQKYSTHYHSLKPSAKKDLIEMVYKEVVQDGARFLIKAPDDEDAYLVVDEEIALQKVSNILRRKKPFVEPTFGSGRIGEGRAGLDPSIQQAMNAGRSHVVGNINPGVASLTNQQMALGNEVARLPTNPLLSSLDSLASGRIGEGTGLNPAIQQAMNAGRSHVVGNINPGVASLTNQQMALGNEVARLPTNPLLSSLDSLASGRIGEGTGLNPAIQQAVSARRSHVVGNMNPGVASLTNHQQMALGNEVARLPTNPLLSSLDSFASLPHASMYHLPNLATNPTEQMRMTLMANMMERDRIVRDALTIQQLNAIQESRAAPFYSQAQNRNVAYLPLANTAVPLAHLQQQPPPNHDETENNKAEDEESEDKG